MCLESCFAVIVASDSGKYFSISKMFNMNGCDFKSFSTVFQSYQDDELIIMKGYCGTCTIEKVPTLGKTRIRDC